MLLRSMLRPCLPRTRTRTGQMDIQGYKSSQPLWPAIFNSRQSFAIFYSPHFSA